MARDTRYDSANIWNGSDACKAQTVDLHAERKALERAATFADFALHQKGQITRDASIVFINRDGLRDLLAAARKHLDTLPKPEPKFRVVGQRRCGGRDENGPFHFRQNADGQASEWMATGKYNSVSVEQVSP